MAKRIALATVIAFTTALTAVPAAADHHGGTPGQRVEEGLGLGTRVDA